MKTAAAFKQADVVRAMKAARKAGASVARVEIEPGGKIVVVIGDPTKAPASAAAEPNEWDDVLEPEPQ